MCPCSRTRCIQNLKACAPCCVCSTSGWNCTRYSPRAASSAAATGSFRYAPKRQSPARALQYSRCGSSSTRCPPTRPRTASRRRRQCAPAFLPYSRSGARHTLPPSTCVHKLRTVADAQHRHAQAEQFFAYRGRIGQIHAVGPAREDNAPWLLFSRIASKAFLYETISEYTWLSRTRRAISWLYWPPKSTTSTISFILSFLSGSPAKPRGAPCRTNFHSYTV